MLPSFLSDAFASLRHPKPIYLVGGPVRDHLLNRPCHDWDFTCAGAKKAARALRRILRATLITLDDHRQIFRLILPGAGERLTIDFAECAGGAIEKDLARRDFTVNAMAVPVARGEAGRVIDPFNGQRDLRRKRLRAVSAAAFHDDPLRLLRAFRFSAQLSFSIEPRTLRLIRKNPGALGRVARERVREEWLRLLSQPGAARVVAAMDQAKLLTVLFPEFEACRRTAIRFYGRGGVLTHSLHTLANLDWILSKLGSDEWPLFKTVLTPLRRFVSEPVGGFPTAAWLRFAALLHDVGKPATAQVIKGRLRFFGHEDVGAGIALRMAERLRCSRQESLVVRQWVRHHMRPGNLAAAERITEKAPARFFRDLGENGVGMLLISLADHYDYLAKRRWGKRRDPVERLSERFMERFYLERQNVLPPRIIDGHLLMKKLKLKPGPIIGRLLEAVQDAQVEGKIKTAADALRQAKRMLPKLRTADGNGQRKLKT